MSSSFGYIMSLAVGVPANADLDLGDLKSPSSQESGLGTVSINLMSLVLFHFLNVC